MAPEPNLHVIVFGIWQCTLAVTVMLQVGDPLIGQPGIIDCNAWHNPQWSLRLSQCVTYPLPPSHSDQYIYGCLLVRRRGSSFDAVFPQNTP